MYIQIDFLNFYRFQDIIFILRYFDGLMQKGRYSSALTTELHLFCSEPSIYTHMKYFVHFIPVVGVIFAENVYFVIWAILSYCAIND